ncbi:MAG TPA: helix-turn-helix transcriptional regulator [Patescibacteria group bacterium]|nr:helix-turn-helix transcriptional regulator [Patescibacteria group bacterium]
MGFKEEIAKIFKEAREKAGLTQAEVAKKAGINANYYARVERGDPKARGEILNKIARALEIKIKLPLGE